MNKVIQKNIYISAPTQIDKFELPEFELTTCTVSDIQDYLKYIIKK